MMYDFTAEEILGIIEYKELQKLVVRWCKFYGVRSELCSEIASGHNCWYHRGGRRIRIPEMICILMQQYSVAKWNYAMILKDYNYRRVEAGKRPFGKQYVYKLLREYRKQLAPMKHKVRSRQDYVRKTTQRVE